MWCGDVVITGVKWQISRHTAGDITLVAVEDRLIRSFHLAAQHMSGLWGTKHYCWQSCIKRWCLILHILHTEAATIARKSLESVNWSLEMEHSCMLDPSRCPAAHHSSQCVAMFKWSWSRQPCWCGVSPPLPPPHTIPFSKPLRKHHLLPLAISHTSPQYCRIDR